MRFLIIQKIQSKHEIIGKKALFEWLCSQKPAEKKAGVLESLERVQALILELDHGVCVVRGTP